MVRSNSVRVKRRVSAGPGSRRAGSPQSYTSRVRLSQSTRSRCCAGSSWLCLAGGISFDEINEKFMLRKQPGVFVAGEMLDWEAPTGGYLLQASFATGVAAAEGALACLKGMIEQSTPTAV